MRMPTFILLPLLWCAAASAQNAAPSLPSQPPSATPSAPANLQPGPPSSALPDTRSGDTKSAGTDQRIERIRIEDGGSVVDELRYGGETRSITVQPKADVPSYEIVPGDSPRSRGLARDAFSGAPGQRVWNFFKF